MPKFLSIATYTAEGAKGLAKEGGTARRTAIEQALKGLGARLEGFYFALGDADAYVITDGPDNATAAALSLAVGQSGLARVKTVALLTPEEMDQATKKAVAYRGPGR